MDCHSVPTFSCKHVEGYMAKSRKVLTFHEYMQNMAKSASPKKRSRIKKQENPPSWRPTNTAEPEYTATPEPSPTFYTTPTNTIVPTATTVSDNPPGQYSDERNFLYNTPMPLINSTMIPPGSWVNEGARGSALRGMTGIEPQNLIPTSFPVIPTKPSRSFIVSNPYINPAMKTVDSLGVSSESISDQANAIFVDAQKDFGEKIGDITFKPSKIRLSADDYKSGAVLDANQVPIFPATLGELLELPRNPELQAKYGRSTYNADDLRVIANAVKDVNNITEDVFTANRDVSEDARTGLQELANKQPKEPTAWDNWNKWFFGAENQDVKSPEQAVADTKNYARPLVEGYYGMYNAQELASTTNNLINDLESKAQQLFPVDARGNPINPLPYNYGAVKTQVARDAVPAATNVAGAIQNNLYPDVEDAQALIAANSLLPKDQQARTGEGRTASGQGYTWIDTNINGSPYRLRVFSDSVQAISHPNLTRTAVARTASALGSRTPTGTTTNNQSGTGAVTGARQTATAQAEQDSVTEARDTLASFANNGKGVDNAIEAISVLRQYRPDSVTIDDNDNYSYTDPVTQQVITVNARSGAVTRNTIPQATGTAQALNRLNATPTATSEPTATTTPTATQSPEEDMAAYDAEKQKLIEDIDIYVKQEKTNTKGFFQRLNALAQMGALKDDAQYGKYLESPSGRVYFGADVNEYLNNNYVLDQSTRPFAVTNPTLTALAGQPPDTASSDSFLPAIGSPLDVAEDEKPLYTPPQALGYVPANWRTDAEIANTYNEPAYVTQRPSYNPTPTPGTGTNTQQGGGNWLQNAWNWVTGNDEQGMVAPKKVYAADRNTATPSVGTATTTRTPTFTATKTTTPTPTQTATTVPAKQTSPQITPTITATQTGAQLQDMQRQRAQQQAQAVLSQSQNKAVSRWSAPNGAMQAAQAQAQQPAPNGAMQAAQAQQQIQPKPAVPAVPPFDPSKMGYTAPTATVQYGTYKPASSATTGAAGTAGTPATSTTTQPAVTAPSVATQTVGTKGSAKLARDKKKHGKLKKDISVGTGLTAHATQPVKESPMPKIKTSYGRYKYPKSSPSSTKYGVTNDTFRKQMNVMYPRQEMANVMPMPPAREHNRVQQMPMSYESPQYVRKMAGSEGMNDMQFTAPSLPKMPEQKRDVQKYTSANLNKYEKRGK